MTNVLSSETLKRLDEVFDKHKKYCGLYRKLCDEPSDPDDRNFDLFVLSMLYNYEKRLDELIVDVGLKLEIKKKFK
jgi:hypothetical protein